MKYICTENCELQGFIDSERNWQCTSLNGYLHYRFHKIDLYKGDFVKIRKINPDRCCKHNDEIFCFEIEQSTSSVYKRIFLDENTVKRFFRDIILEHYEIKQFDSITEMNEFLKKLSL